MASPDLSTRAIQAIARSGTRGPEGGSTGGREEETGPPSLGASDRPAQTSTQRRRQLRQTLMSPSCAIPSALCTASMREPTSSFS
jgi:hypothetical protein